MLMRRMAFDLCGKWKDNECINNHMCVCGRKRLTKKDTRFIWRMVG